MALHDDRTFVRHFSWVILFLAVMLIIFIFLSFLIVGVTGVEDHSGYSYVQYMQKHPAVAAAPATVDKANETIPPVAAATLNVAAASNAKTNAPAGNSASTSINGEAIWKGHCAACHATGVMGAPKIGDKEAWAPILAKYDLATLYKHAIHGFGAMPPKGGAMSLSKDQVDAAVRYMLKQSGWQGG